MKEQLINRYKKNIPKELQDTHQWIVYRKIPRTTRDGKVKISKVPLSALTLSGKDWNTKDKWTSFEQVLSVLVNSRVDGLAFVLSSDDPFTCIDLDHAIHGETLNLQAKAIIETFSDSFMELSQSKQGIHIFCKGHVPNNLNNQLKGVEIYQEN
ncbi:MAG: hypothetical protein Q4G11_05525, partial [Gallicola sp.]|nr:hypothetical protein [Gallicola sp.]